LPIAAGMTAGAIVSALVGVLVALVTVRLRGDYLAIVTLGFAESIRIVASNTISLTNGTDGISGIAGPWRGSLSPEAFNLLYLAVVGAVAIVFLLESTRFVIPLVPGVSAVQGAAVRELMIASLLIVMLRYKPAGLVPERLPRLPVPPVPPPATRYQPTA